MGRLLTTILMILTVSSTVGCYSCMQGGYYDPCGGMIYGPSVQPMPLFNGLKKSRHDEKSCPICQAETPRRSKNKDRCEHCHHQHRGSSDCRHDNCSCLGGAVNPQCYGAAFSAEPSCDAPYPSATTSCSCGAPGIDRGCSCSGQSSCSCSSVSDCACSGSGDGWIDTNPRCTACGQIVPDSTSSGCPTCPTMDTEWPTGDVIYDGSPSYSEPMILPGEVVMPDTFAPSDCPTCQPGVSGPIFDGTIVPNDSAAKPTTPTPQPAPPAESVPGTTPETVPGATPQPSPIPGTTLLIPAEADMRPARHVHWVPNVLK